MTCRELAAADILLGASCFGAMAQEQRVSPSPSWMTAMPTGPVAGTKITAAYATMVARDAFFWA
jgi:hypothetical protein